MQPEEYRRMFEAEDRHWWYTALHELILGTVRREWERKGPLVILDAGCGTGRLLLLLSAFGTVEGMDVAEQALGFCRQRNLTNLRQADLGDADLGCEVFDVVTMIDVLYHRRIADDSAALGAVFRSLKPGGVLVLQVPAYEWLRSDHDRAVHTERRYVLPQIRKLLAEAGFGRPERLTYRVAFLFPVIALVRTVQKVRVALFGAKNQSSDLKEHSGAMNALLTAIQRLEHRLLDRVALPFGASVYAIARKPVKD